MAEHESERDIKVLVTGFGSFLNVTGNPSWEVARRLPSNLAIDSKTIRIIVPDAALPSAYHKILATTPALIEKHDPDIVVHIGLDRGRECFAVEQSAPKEGYHEIPDIDRKVFTRAENKKLFAKAPSSLSSALDLEAAVSAVCANLHGDTLPVTDAASGQSRGKGKGKPRGKPVDVQLSDDVGNYVCGFVYYVGLLEMQKRGKGRAVVFLHIPWLDGEGEVKVGVRVVEELIKALVGVSDERN